MDEERRLPQALLASLNMLIETPAGAEATAATRMSRKPALSSTPRASAFMRNKHELRTTKNKLIVGQRVLLKQALRIAMPVGNRGVFALPSWLLHG